MSNVIQHLHADHVNMARLLDLMEAEVAKVAKEGQPNYPYVGVCLALVDELSRWSASPHSRCAVRQAPRDGPGSGAAGNDAQTGASAAWPKGCRVLRYAPGRRKRRTGAPHWCAAMGREYIDMLRAHMNKEETGLLKCAEPSSTGRISKTLSTG